MDGDLICNFVFFLEVVFKELVVLNSRVSGSFEFILFVFSKASVEKVAGILCIEEKRNFSKFSFFVLLFFSFL